MPSRTTVCIVDDDDQICRWMARFLDSHGLRTATFDSGSRLLEAFDPVWTGCLVVDLRMPGMNGLELQEALHQRGSTLPIIMVSGAADVPMTVRAMEQGATSLLQKPLRANELLGKVHEALLLNERQRKRIARQTDARGRLARLSSDEHRALELVLAGLGNKQLAARLAVSLRTAELRRACLLQKTQVDSIAELVQLVCDARDATLQPAHFGEAARALGGEDQLPARG